MEDGREIFDDEDGDIPEPKGMITMVIAGTRNIVAFLAHLVYQPKSLIQASCLRLGKLEPTVGPINHLFTSMPFNKFSYLFFTTYTKRIMPL